MPAIDGFVPFSLICAWHKIAVRAQWLEPKYLGENVGSNWHPTFTAFRKKIFFGSIHDPDAAIADPVNASVHDLNVAHPQTRKQKVGYIRAGIAFRQHRRGSVHGVKRLHIERPWQRTVWRLDSFAPETGQIR